MATYRGVHRLRPRHVVVFDGTVEVPQRAVGPALTGEPAPPRPVDPWRAVADFQPRLWTPAAQREFQRLRRSR